MPPVRAKTLAGELARRGLTIEQAAVLTELRPSTVSRIVAGKSRAQPKTVVALARGLGVGASRMRSMCDTHFFEAHPEEDLAADEVA